MISVIIPLYNKAHTIVNTLNTIMNQSYKDFEVIIVNDGSTDNGVEKIINSFNDERIKIISQENSGVSAARNNGVEISKGDWISFIDGDDQWHPDYLLIINNVIDKYKNIGLICTGGLCTNLKTNKIDYRIAKKYINQIVEINFFENPCVFSHTSGVTIKKDIFKAVHGFPLGMKCCEDYACTQSIALITRTIYIGLPISKYVGGVEGQTTSIDAETRYKYLEYVVNYYNSVMNNFKYYRVENKLFKIYFKYDIRHRIKGFLKDRNYRSLEYFLKSLSIENLNLLNKFEKFLYKNHNRFLSILFINVTKIIWRMHRFPIVGEKIDSKLISSRYKKW